MAKKILIAGATGTIGINLCKMLVERGDEVTVLARDPESAKKRIQGAADIIKWDGVSDTGLTELIEGKYAVINLIGAPVIGGKWNDAYKLEILKSRTESTKSLVNAMGRCTNKPKVFLCSSAIGYYGNRGNEVITENSLPGNDFISTVCIEWEKEAKAAEEFGIRWVSLRTGIVLDTKGGALAKMLTSFKYYLGGHLGTGESWFSWIHIKDICRIFLFALEADGIKGGINATAPISDTWAEFSRTLGRVLKRPALFHIPEFLVRLLLGEGAEVLLSSQRVLPVVLNRAGFKFEFVKAEDALKDLLKK